MAVSFERLRARIACCRHALQNASQDMLSVHSLAQRNAIEDMLQRSTLDAEERASIVIELGQCSFTRTDAFALAELAAGKRKNVRQRQLQWQDYTQFHEYITDSLQNDILANRLHAAELEQRIFELLGHLGLRRASEATLKRLSSFFAVVCESPETRASMDHRSKWSYKNVVAEKLKKYLNLLAPLDAEQLCMALPSSPAGLLLTR